MKNKGCLRAFLLVVAIAAFLVFTSKGVFTPRNLADEDPRHAFESFVCSPPPKSVREIIASGAVALAGGNVSIEFQIDPHDIEELVRRGKFELADGRANQWMMDFKPKGVTGNIVRYIRINEGTSQTALFVTEDQRSAWFHEIQF